MRRSLLGIVILTLAQLVCAAPLRAQATQQPPTLAPPFKVTILVNETDVSGAPGKVFVMLTAEFPPGIGTGRHTHPGDEYGTVLEGSVQTMQAGGEWKTVNAGQSYYVPANVVHETKNNGTVVAKTVNAFVVDKGKPRATPAP